MFEDLEKSFSTKVEERVIKNRCGYMEAVNTVCEERELEPELVAKYLSKPIIDRIKFEAQKVNLLPRGPQLFSDDA